MASKTEAGLPKGPDDKGPDDKGPGQEPKKYIFFVMGTKYETDQKALTGLQIKARVPSWEPSHDLLLEGHGNDPDTLISDDQVVSLEKDHGPPRFSSVPKANFG